MKQMTTAILAFIKEFNLNHPTKGICFEARVYIYTKNVAVKIESEVQIITIGAMNVDVVYLLNPDLGLKSLPDIFESGDNYFSYQPNYGLVIRGFTIEHGEYKIMIQPKNKDCAEATLDEIHAKINN